VNTTGAFALYPIPTNTSYQVVITGDHMQTMVIKDVATATPGVLAALSYTTLGSSSTPIVPTIVSTNIQTVSLGTALTSVTSAHLYVGQRLSGTIPYEVTGANVDPFSGVLAQNLAVPEGTVYVTTYTESSASNPSFTAVTQDEGSGKYSMVVQGTVYDDASSVSTPTLTAATANSITVTNPTRKTAVGTTGQITVNLSGGLSGSYSTAYVVVSDVNGVVATQSASSCGSSCVINVPAGSNAAALSAGAVYTVALRASGSSANSIKWVRAAQTVDLRSNSASSVSLALP